MKRLRLFAVFMLMAFAFACFLSMPALSNDDWPWDADNGPGSEPGSESPGDSGEDSTAVDAPGYSSGSNDMSFWLFNVILRSSHSFVIGYLVDSETNSGRYRICRESADKTVSEGPGKRGFLGTPAK